MWSLVEAHLHPARRCHVASSNDDDLHGMPQRPPPCIGGDLILEAGVAATLQVNSKERAHIEATRALLCTDAAQDQCLVQGKRGALLATQSLVSDARFIPCTVYN